MYEIYTLDKRFIIVKDKLFVSSFKNACLNEALISFREDNIPIEKVINKIQEMVKNGEYLAKVKELSELKDIFPEWFI